MPERCHVTLLKINAASPMEFNDRLKASPAVHHRPAFVVKAHDGRGWQIIHFPASIPDALSVIRIDMVGKPFIQTPNLIYYFPADHD